jgi:hypothetical protein
MDINDAIVAALAISGQNKMVFPQSKHKWTDSEAVVNLLQSCHSQEDYDLVVEMFQQLNENIVDNARSYDLLCQMAQNIMENEAEGEHTALCVMRTKNDTDADGSQAIINELKMAIKMTGGFKHTYSAVCFEDIEWLYKKKGYRHFVVVDDFIGSGKTVVGRYGYFMKRHLADATIGFYFMAGMDEGVAYCKSKGIPVYCCKVMHKGITEHYHDDLLHKRIASMDYLESLLGEASGSARLEDHRFGYGRAESLYCRQFGNIPNSVFPIFWWNKHQDGSNRKSVFTRVQDGY